MFWKTHLIRAVIPAVGLFACGCATSSPRSAYVPATTAPVYFESERQVPSRERVSRYDRIWSSVFTGTWPSVASVRVISEEWEKLREPRGSEHQPGRLESYHATVELKIGSLSFMLTESAFSPLGTSESTTAVQAVAERLARRVTEHLEGFGLIK